MNQVEVKILQQSYLLACKEGQESRLSEAVGLVDGAMTRIHDTGKVRARERIAVLAALNLAYELGDLRQSHAQLLEQLPPASVAANTDAVVEPAWSEDAAAAYSAQTQALEALVARLEAVLQPADAAGFAQDHEAAQAQPEPAIDAAAHASEAAPEPTPQNAHQHSEQEQQAGFF